MRKTDAAFYQALNDRAIQYGGSYNAAAVHLIYEVGGNDLCVEALLYLHHHRLRFVDSANIADEPVIPQGILDECGITKEAILSKLVRSGHIGISTRPVKVEPNKINSHNQRVMREWTRLIEHALRSGLFVQDWAVERLDTLRRSARKVA
jgi:hypothetical protein